MTLTVDTIKLATDKKFTDFSKAIKSSLHDKLANNADSRAYSDEIDSMRSMKSKFIDINSKE